ncbi:MAG: hypothetical protein AAF004_15655 [Pseudomonadota bacterium]
MSSNDTRDGLTPAQISQLANARPQGKRPQYFRDAMAEQNYSICMALMAELASARERIDTLERLLIGKGVLSDDDVDTYVPDAESGQARQLAQVEYCARVLRPLQQQVDAMAGRQDLDIDDMAARLAQTDSMNE